jgi:hypothetical protein
MVISDAERIAQELHRATRLVIEARSRLSDITPPVRDWIDLDGERRRIAIEVVETLLANGLSCLGRLGTSGLRDRSISSSAPRRQGSDRSRAALPSPLRPRGS